MTWIEVAHVMEPQGLEAAGRARRERCEHERAVIAVATVTPLDTTPHIGAALRQKRCGTVGAGLPSYAVELGRLVAGQLPEVTGEIELVVRQKMHHEMRRASGHAIRMVDLGQVYDIASRDDAALPAEPHETTGDADAVRRGDHDHRRVERRHRPAERRITHDSEGSARRH